MFAADEDQYRATLVALIRAERALEQVVVDVMDEWLQTTRYVILRELAGRTGITAAGGDDAVEAASAAYETWRKGLNNRIIPQISIAFGKAYRDIRDGHPPQRYEAEYLQTVKDRLTMWPEGAFHAIRYELADALRDGEDFDQMRDRIGTVLGINARSQSLLTTIRAIEYRLEHEELPRTEFRALAARRRDLWEEYDDSLGDWRWKARRIARTEAHAAQEWARIKAAGDIAFETGRPVYKRWRAANDLRVRPSHRVADGQVVKVFDAFRVGGFMLRFPGDPAAAAPHESINCRCVCTIYTGDMLQDALQGPDGSIGQVRPGGVRVGPDDPDRVDQAIDEAADKLGRPRPPKVRGENHGQVPPDPAELVPLTPERAVPLPDLSSVDDDVLVDMLEAAHDDSDDDLYEFLDAEWDRRRDIENDGNEPEWVAADGPPDPPNDDPPTTAGLPGGADDDDDDGSLGGPNESDAAELAAHLDASLAGDELDESQRFAVARWQGMDRFYQRVQNAVRGDGETSREAEELADALDELIDARPLDRDVIVWRGIRNASAMFGMTSDALSNAVGSEIPPGGFIATSSSREVAVSFTAPGQDPVLLRVLARAGNGALWVSRGGSPDLADQSELLFGASTLYIVGISVTDDGFVQVDVEMR